MSTVYSHMTMSLDGFIADPQDGCDELFAWYGAGDVAVPTAQGFSFQLDEGSAGVMREVLGGAGAMISGRRLFDLTNGWDDNHPIGTPVVVVTHAPPADAERWPRTSFVDGVAESIEAAKGIAAGKDVVIASASIAAQALDLGMLDAIAVSLVPVVLGSGIPYFANLAKAPHRLDDPVVTPGVRATHLTYAVRH